MSTPEETASVATPENEEAVETPETVVAESSENTDSITEPKPLLPLSPVEAARGRLRGVRRL